MQKIKLNYTIEILGEFSFEQIYNEVNAFRIEKEKELKAVNMDNDFEIVIEVKMSNKSISL